MARPRAIDVGCDRVLLDGDERIVIANRELPDWQPTRFRRTAVVFQGATYFVAACEGRDAGRVDPSQQRGYRYRLSPWPADLADRPARTIVYDDDTVDVREREYAGVHARALVRVALMPAYPLLGLLPFVVKQSLAARCGLHVLAATEWSLRLEYVTVLVLGIAFWVEAWIPGTFGVSAWAILATSFGVLADFVMRWDPANERAKRQPGAFEWLFHRP